MSSHRVALRRIRCTSNDFKALSRRPIRISCMILHSLVLIVSNYRCTGGFLTRACRDIQQVHMLGDKVVFLDYCSPIDWPCKHVLLSYKHFVFICMSSYQHNSWPSLFVCGKVGRRTAGVTFFAWRFEDLDLNFHLHSLYHLVRAMLLEQRAC